MGQAFWRRLTGHLQGMAGHLRDRAGATAVEFAMVFPIFALATFGVVEVGRYEWTLLSVQQAAESTARYAMAHPDATDAEVEAEVETYLYAMDFSEVTPVVSHDLVSSVNYVTVTLTATYTPIIGMVGFEEMTVTGYARMPYVN